MRTKYNRVRACTPRGYVTPDDEHEGTDDAIRQARENRIAHHRTTTLEENQ